MSKSSIPQPVMHLCRTHGVHGLGKGGNLKPWGGLARTKTRKPSLIAHPPLHPAPYHGGSHTVVGRGGVLDPATQPPQLDWTAHPDCVLAQERPPP